MNVRTKALSETPSARARMASWAWTVLGTRATNFPDAAPPLFGAGTGSFLAFNASTPPASEFAAANGGVRVATLDRDNNGRAEIAVGAGSGSTASTLVRLLDGVTFAELDAFFAFEDFTGGTFVGGR